VSRVLAIFLALFLPLCVSAAANEDALGTLERRCLACHNVENPTAKLNLSTRTGALTGGLRGPALVPGNPSDSLLYQRVASGEMPPGGRLPEEEATLIRDWIDGGADWETELTAAPSARSGPDWWAWQPVAPVTSSIDELVLDKLRENSLEPNPAADRRTLIRRLSFDLTGLAPTFDEIEAFENDQSPESYERLVDRLLASPAYGERWGRHWLDVARFGESNGYEQNHLRNNAWPYRDYVIRSLNDDKPFDQFIVEQIAGDQIAPDDPDVTAATGFLVAGPHDTVAIKNISGELQKRANHLDDMITATASGFLGLTVHCARCHDHKFDPIQAKDYYRLQSAFAGVTHGERAWGESENVRVYQAQVQRLQDAQLEAKTELDRLRDAANERVQARREEILATYRPSVDAAGVEESFAPAAARFVRMTIDNSTGRRTVDMDEFEVWTSDSRNVTAGAVATAGSSRLDSASPDTYAPKNLVDSDLTTRWISASRPPTWVQIKLAKAETISRVYWSSDRLKGFQGRFGRSIPEQYRIEVSLDGEHWEPVADSKDRLPYREEDRERLLLFAVFDEDEKRRWREIEDQQSKIAAETAALDKPRQAFIGSFTQPEEPSFVMLRGDPMSRGDTVAPASPSTLGRVMEGFELEPNAPEGQRRLALARWIAGNDNPLTARVIVNRIWMHHFGAPLARNPSDFGYNGGAPTHPKLLDYLASKLVNDYEWRWKPLHKEIVMSSAYQRGGEFRPDPAKIDSDSQYLWRFPPRRLSAEEVRDAVLAASGKLDRTMGGPGFRLYRYTVDNVATYYPLETFGPETYRRSVYHQHARSVKPELLGQFDCPDTSLPAPKRVTTTSPLQALALLNNSFMLDQARFLADRVGPGDAAEQVKRAYRIVFGRDPDDDELSASARFVEEHGLFLLCRALFNANEFVYVM